MAYEDHEIDAHHVLQIGCRLDSDERRGVGLRPDNVCPENTPTIFIDKGFVSARVSPSAGRIPIRHQLREDGMQRATKSVFAVAVLTLAVSGSIAGEHNAVRVRGTIERIDGQVFVVKARDGAEWRLTLRRSR